VTASRPAEFEAVTTKLLVPERRHGLVDRPQLVHALEDARAGRLTIVSAPTGFGKTSTVVSGPRPARIRRHLGAITRDEAVTVARRRELI
jgi:ATP/maltotriose-dependent transcriptional regulator MalT